MVDWLGKHRFSVAFQQGSEAAELREFAHIDSALSVRADKKAPAEPARAFYTFRPLITRDLPVIH